MIQRLSTWFMDFQMTFGLSGPPLSRVTPEQWAQKVRQGVCFNSVPKDKRTEEVCLAAVHSNAWSAMKDLLTREQRTRPVVLAALQIDGRLISCLTPEERTPEVCLAAVLQNSGVLAQLTAEEITHDLALAAVSKSGSAILELNDTLRTPEVCLASVQLYHWNIQHLTAAQRTPQVCLAAVQQSGYAIRYLTSQERTPEICLAALKVSIADPESESCIQYLTPEECARPLVREWLCEHWDQLEQTLLQNLKRRGEGFKPEFAESIQRQGEEEIAHFNRIRCALEAAPRGG